MEQDQPEKVQVLGEEWDKEAVPAQAPAEAEWVVRVWAWVVTAFAQTVAKRCPTRGGCPVTASPALIVGR
jgi:hypothetical protein